MLQLLLEPLNYDYLLRAMWVCALVGAVCGFISSFLMLKGWSLMGDALAHSIVPGVAVSYILAMPYALGAFFAGLMAALSMTLLKQKTKLREDVAIGLVFTGFLSIGLILASIYPISVNLQAIIIGNVLAISDQDVWQIVIICLLALLTLMLKWRDFAMLFFDQNHCHSLGISVKYQSILFFTVLSAVAVVALQAVGACLVIAMLVTPGATAYLLTDRFVLLNIMALTLGATSGLVGAYFSYFLDLPPGGFIVLVQTLLFLLAFSFSRKYGLRGSYAHKKYQLPARF